MIKIILRIVIMMRIILIVVMIILTSFSTTPPTLVSHLNLIPLSRYLISAIQLSQVVIKCIHK